jgi:threonine dehydrogenase-like Zn-dependent dehydrogenase
MKAARFIDVGQIKFSDEPIPKPKADEIVIKVKASGICGTDHHIYKGEVKGLVKTGTVLGHEFAGEVTEIGTGISNFQIGDRIAVEPNLFCGACHYCRNAKKHFCEHWAAVGLSRDGGFAEYCVIPASAAYKMPKNLEYKNAAFFEPMACVLHGIERARVKVGETVVVQGAGSIGQLYVQALKKLGATNVIVADIDSDKLKLAKKFGANLTVNAKTENLIDIVKAETNGIGAQVLIDAAGLLTTIPTAYQLLENTGRVVIFGVPPEGKKVEISPYDIYRRELEIIGSFTNPYTNEAALEMLATTDVDPIITNPIKLDDLVNKGLNMMGKPGVMKVQIQF